MKLFLAVAFGIAFGVALIPYVSRLLVALERHGPRMVRRALPFIGVVSGAAILILGGMAGFNAVQRSQAAAQFTRDSVAFCVNVPAADTLVAAVDRAIATHDARYASPEAFDAWENAKRVRARCDPYRH
ncbi:MAG: hypothetical protein JWL61_5013 [Gemmatimonadetes bacterium]|nr:hypothetical protein [Gemmatimonadota bacterium]